MSSVSVDRITHKSPLRSLHRFLWIQPSKISSKFIIYKWNYFMRICITANGLLMRLKLNNKFVCNASAHNISSVRCHRGCHSYCVCYFGRIGLMHTVHFALHVHIWLSAYCKRNIWGLNTCTHASRNRNCISLLLLLFLLPIMIVMCQNVWVFIANDEPSKLKFGNYSDGTALMSRTWQSIAHRS